MDYFAQLINGLQPLTDLLGRLGIAEQQRQSYALGILFLLVTLLVLLLIVLLLRRSARPKAERPQAEPVSESTDEAPIADEAVAAEAVEGEVEEPSRPAAAVEPVAVSVAEETVAVETEEPEPVSLLQRMRQGLAKTQAGLVGRIDSLLSGHARVDDDLLEELEEVLITADLGMQTTRQLVAAVEERLGRSEAADPQLVRQVLKQEMISRLTEVDSPLDLEQASPLVIMVVGVNGVGKTTTIGKLARLWTSRGKKVVLGAGDTFRAAAAEQLAIWGERAGVDVIRHAEGADPGAVAFDAARAAVARKADILLLDTAGRLHTKANLMEELKKIRRILEREIPGAPHETLLVLDATTGQNALIQARLFKEAVEVNGLVLTKLDGTARGGIIVAIANDLGLPVRFVGIGEGADDLRPFDPEMFVRALFE
ncbi:signal recognition particle-docking protein FtsY [Geothermobacter hydrogeniphilus]|uniref:Signal recognition particle receptor FtsY n=1 Tax=Geothermobacter hydrogeniphilus TaxID=1969733 RepID=A0A2K2HD64_9BACT|nr:signal recognition particle-docking protein FtsY [Geothermobacter hydrogeniphilus]PNU21238.1 signal recognition particle-docking protein FtsY [Geothermobacter hydrogeniphilus]